MKTELKVQTHCPNGQCLLNLGMRRLFLVYSLIYNNPSPFAAKRIITTNLAIMIKASKSDSSLFLSECYHLLEYRINVILFVYGMENNNQ